MNQSALSSSRLLINVESRRLLHEKAEAVFDFQTFFLFSEIKEK